MLRRLRSPVSMLKHSFGLSFWQLFENCFFSLNAYPTKNTVCVFAKVESRCWISINTGLYVMRLVWLGDFNTNRDVSTKSSKTCGSRSDTCRQAENNNELSCSFFLKALKFYLLLTVWTLKCVLKPAMTFGFKFQLLHMTKGVLAYCTIQYI